MFGVRVQRHIMKKGAKNERKNYSDRMKKTDILYYAFRTHMHAHTHHTPTHKHKVKLYRDIYKNSPGPHCCDWSKLEADNRGPCFSGKEKVPWPDWICNLLHFLSLPSFYYICFPLCLSHFSPLFSLCHSFFSPLSLSPSSVVGWAWIK